MLGLREMVREVTSELVEAPIFRSSVLLPGVVFHLGPLTRVRVRFLVSERFVVPLTQTILMSKKWLTFFHI